MPILLQAEALHVECWNVENHLLFYFFVFILNDILNAISSTSTPWTKHEPT